MKNRAFIKKNITFLKSHLGGRRSAYISDCSVCDTHAESVTCHFIFNWSIQWISGLFSIQIELKVTFWLNRSIFYLYIFKQILTLKKYIVEFDTPINIKPIVMQINLCYNKSKWNLSLPMNNIWYLLWGITFKL